jgi:putative glutamine amidotransferase
MRMTRKPIIGINLDYRAADNGSFSCLYSGYYDAISEAGGLPLLIPPLRSELDIYCVLDAMDGVVLTGGADLDCRRDGFQLHHTMRMLDSRRETFDRMLVGILKARKIPTLGIGCGMQLLNVHGGGTLFLDIPEDRPKAIAHRDPFDPTTGHPMLTEDGSFIHRVFCDCITARVSSVHHQAVDDVAPGFLVTGRCSDGIVEAIESTTEWFAVGVQFHPELEGPGSRMGIVLFTDFVDCVRARMRRAAELAA